MAAVVKRMATEDGRSRSELFREMVLVYQRYRAMRAGGDEKWISRLIRRDAEAEERGRPCLPRPVAGCGWGDRHLRLLKSYRSIPIVTPAEALRVVELSEVPISRRRFLTAAPAALAGCARRPRAAAPGPAGPRLARVLVAPERVIRTIAGLRPFRPSGFVVRAETSGDKTIIHHYGHGGAGITLSWGTAHLAVAMAAGTGRRECAVIGCGVAGLSTARLLQERGFAPVIYTRDTPPNTTSNVAGGLWSPVTLFEPERVTPEFRRQFVEAARFAHRRYQSMMGDRYGVRWLPVYSLSRQPFAAPAGTGPARDIDDLFFEVRRLAPGEHPFGALHARRLYTMLIEPAIYLNALIRDFLLQGGRIVIRNFAEAGELAQLRENLIFNCTGLGAGALFGDRELTPVKGQLSFLLPQPEVDYCTVGPDDIYMFPRRDGILLGGSHERGVWSTEPDPAIAERIQRENAALFGAMAAT